ncbi:MAG TPA: ATP-binding protein [Sedimentisphaerales bacterium]|nr:ATP-binding protein [Sedimentisphaerales bacterium]
MASILEKRTSLHRSLAAQNQQNQALKSQIARIQPLASIGLISSMIAHELNNILTPLANYAQLSLDHPDDAGLRDKALMKTVLNCQRACDIQQSLLALANGQNQKKQTANLLRLVEEVFTCMCRDFSKEKILIVVEIKPDIEVLVVPSQIQQVVMNLVLNSRQAMLPGGGTISIRGWRSDDRVVLAVSDTGPGISPEVLPHIFEPFVTTRADGTSSADGGGSGLGLAFCREVVNAHDGAITVESQPSQGATFKIILPI